MNRKLIIAISAFVALSAYFVATLEYKPSYTAISTIFMIALCIPTYYYFIKNTDTGRAILTTLSLSLLSRIIETIRAITIYPAQKILGGKNRKDEHNRKS